MSLGATELILILVIVFVIFGAGKLPQVMKDVGKTIRNLKTGLKEEERLEKNTKSQKDNNSKSS
jgi:sec-independent protein translocase protein TatA